MYLLPQCWHWNRRPRWGLSWARPRPLPLPLPGPRDFGGAVRGVEEPAEADITIVLSCACAAAGGLSSKEILISDFSPAPPVRQLLSRTGSSTLPSVVRAGFGTHCWCCGAACSGTETEAAVFLPLVFLPLVLLRLVLLVAARGSITDGGCLRECRGASVAGDECKSGTR